MFIWVIMVMIGFGCGVVTAGGIFAFIAIIGIVPRFAQKTSTTQYIIIYENSIMLGGILGGWSIVIDLYIPLGTVGAIFIGLFGGIFIGSLAVSLAETLDVLPILSRRFHLKTGMGLFLLSISMGKMLAALIYWIVPGFVQYK